MIIDEARTDIFPNRVTNELSELSDEVSIVESFSHVITVRTGDGLVAFDSSGRGTGRAVVDALRSWSTEPVHSLVYTHGHMDHVGGSVIFAEDAEARGHARPRVIGHEKLNDRLGRYRMTDGYNNAINLRQFGGVASRVMGSETLGGVRSFVPEGVLEADTTYDGVFSDTVGGVDFEFNHAMGETDDHTWTWIPEHRMISAGDLFIWNFPNCGNPQKVQRYPLEWVAALRAMAMKGAELFVPAHGLPITGAARIEQVLVTVANTLEKLAIDVIDAMNTGARLDEILHEVSVDPALLELPYLRPFYDEPEFVVHNLWRLYGGWWDGNPARLKPAPDAQVATEMASLAGGALALAKRAVALAESGELRLACHLAEMAGLAEPESVEVHTLRAEVFSQRRGAETSLMAKGIFGSAVAESTFVVTGEAAEAKVKLDLDPNRDRAE